MDKVILEKLKDKPLLPEEIEKAITSQAILFGSHSFGGATPESDIDYIIPPNFQYTWEDLIPYGVVHQVDDYSNIEVTSIYFKTKNRVLNLMFVHNNLYKIYVKATRIMSGAYGHNIGLCNLVQNKKNRITLFQTIKDMLIEEECKPVKMEDYTDLF